MNNKKLQIIVLAGGQGKRMNSDLPKVLVPLSGQPMIKHLLKSIKKSGICERPVMVVGFKADLVKSVLGPEYDYVLQAKQLGTGHAVACAKDFLRGKAEDIFVLYGDQPLLKPETIIKIANYHKEQDKVLTLATLKMPDFKAWRLPFYQFGRIIRNDAGDIKEIVELKDCSEEQKNITEVNPSYFCFKSNWLWENIEKMKNKNAQAEYYLTDLAGIAIIQGKKVADIQIDSKESLGINTAEHLAQVEKIL